MHQESHEIGRGHAEVLMELIGHAMKNAAISFDMLGRIGVVVGPGSFTGIRVGVATARGFGLALNLPVVGISMLDACQLHARDSGYDGSIATVLDARREQVYLKLDDRAPVIASYEETRQHLSGKDFAVCGDPLEFLDELSLKRIHSIGNAPISLVAKMAGEVDGSIELPEPLYLRDADAKPQTGFAVERA